MRVSLVVKFAVPGYLEIPKSTLAPAETVLSCLSSPPRREQRSREPGERDARALRARWGGGAVARAAEGECTARRLGSAQSPESATLPCPWVRGPAAQGALDSILVAGLRV